MTTGLNYYTSAASLQCVLEEPLEKRQGINYGPPGDDTLVYFLDDLKLPHADTYGTQTALCAFAAAS